MQGKTVEYECAEIKTTANAIVRIYRPILTDSERKKRMAAIEKAAADLLKSALKEKGKNYVC